MTSDSQSESGGVVSSTALLGASLRLSKRMPARTKTLTALWCKRDFMVMTQRYRDIRGRLRSPMDTCCWCDHKIADGEMMGLACFTEGGNKVLCQPCADELLASTAAPNKKVSRRADNAHPAAKRTQ